MQGSRKLVLAAVVLTGGLLSGTVARAGNEFAPGEVLFALKVRPLLVEKCFACHGEELKGDLDLTTRAGLLKGGKAFGASIAPGNSADSPLYLAVTRDEPGLVMPPKEADALTREQSWAIRDWIDAGAPWPDEARIAAIIADRAQGVTVPTSGGLSDDWTNRLYEPETLWAYRPLQRPEVPADAGTLPASNPIDLFLNRRLQALDLEPAPRADRRTLIRRVTFDLLGLPPSPDEIEAFLADARPDRDGVRGPRRPAARLAPVRRAVRPPLARPDPICRHLWLCERLRAAQRLALPRLRHSRLQHRQAVSTPSFESRSRAMRSTRTTPKSWSRSGSCAWVRGNRPA